MRTVFPSTIGLKPRLASRMARSTALTSALSHTDTEIIRDSGTKGILLRPLCAKRLPESDAEKSGLVDREKLFAMNGRGRKDQMALAEHFGFTAAHLADMARRLLG